MQYSDFIDNKKIAVCNTGIVEDVTIRGSLFHYQKDIVKWALKKGRAAIFADCGMGKTAMQLEWAYHVNRHTLKPVVILAPLAVGMQTVKEGKKFGIEVNYCRDQSDFKDGINILNYEIIHKFDLFDIGGIVLDESSILKSSNGKTRNLLIDTFKKTQFKLACSATPSPNDYMELGSHSEFLGILNHEEMLAMFFTHDGGETQKWRLKGHARNLFWEWVCGWAIMITKPSDLGYSDEGFLLPSLEYIDHRIKVKIAADGMLFAMPAESLSERIRARRDSVEDRVKSCADMVNASDETWIIWCNLNSEGDLLESSITGAVQISGSDKPEFKERTMLDFTDGKIKCLISKVSICGFGMNWQNCHNIAFVGLSDSYEQFYQAVRRCWRFGQKETVYAHLFFAETEGNVIQNIKRKDEDCKKMAIGMVNAMKSTGINNVKGTERMANNYAVKSESGEGFTINHGDCVEVVSSLPDNSVHFSIFSPPFDSLYTYSSSDRDMGNCATSAEFMQHFGYLVKELYRVIMEGRLVSFHCMNLPTSKVRDGYIGIRDFRGELIKLFESHGFIYHSEVVIWKDPVIAMQRTKALGLLHKQIKKDSSMSRQGIPDYLVTMRKPGINQEPITHTNESFPVDVWQRYASPVWDDINPSRTLQYMSAREHDDERHICPLQLQVIERAMDLWSNPGDTVLSPFAGIGSEGYVAIEKGRKFVGAELKESYFNQAVKNLKSATFKTKDLFEIKS